MFVGTEQNSIKQFFMDIGFIPPQGMTLDYFILPPQTDVNSVVTSNDIPQENIQENPKRGTTIVYLPKDKSKIYSNPKTVAQPQQLQPMPYTPVVDTPAVEDPTAGQTKRLMSPEVKNKIAIVESTKTTFDMKLVEQIERFPKGTFFHFKKDN